MSLTGSRRPSAENEDCDIREEDNRTAPISGNLNNNNEEKEDEDSKGFDRRKGNPDSGFHEEKGSSSHSNSSSTTGARRRPETAGSSSGGQTRHDSIISIVSENQKISQQQQHIINNHRSSSGSHHTHSASGPSGASGPSSDKSGCSTSSGVADTEVDSAGVPETRDQPHIHQYQHNHHINREQRKNFKKRGKHFPPPPKTPPPTAFNGTGPESAQEKTKVDTLLTNYDFPSDTELSEIIAMLSGLASPRKSKVPSPDSNPYDSTSTKPHTAGGKFFDPGHRHNDDEEFNSYHYDDDSTSRSRHAESMPSIRRYDDRPTLGPGGGGNQFHGVPNGVISNNNSKLRHGNAAAGRRYLQKQQWSKSVDAVSVSGSIGGSINDFNNLRKSNTNSLNSILAAGKSGTIGPNGKKKNKQNKPKFKGPPKKEEDVWSEYSTKPSCKQRLKFFLTFIVSVTLILSGSSLLFVVPIVVDPILVGLEAQFSILPAQCRTVSKRVGTGSVECTIPSCREGCTADLVTCYFIDVEYQVGTYTTITKNTSARSNMYLSSTTYNNNAFEPNDDNFNGSTILSLDSLSLPSSPSSESMGFDQYFIPQGPVQNGTLLININGCGYPPEINCTEFEKNYSELDTVFPCHFSQTNDSIVVPAYSRRSEIMLLSISLIVPLGTCLVCAILLYLLLRWHPKPKRNKKKIKEKDKDKEPPPTTHLNHVNKNNASTNNKTGRDVEDGNVKLRLSPTPNEKVNHGSKSRGGGILSDIVGDLTGLSAQNVMKKRHYAKFSSSFSNPSSQTNSRKGSSSATHAATIRRSGLVVENSLDSMELERIETADHLRMMASTDDDDDGLRRGRKGRSDGSSDLHHSITSTTFVDHGDYYYDVNEKKDSSSSSSKVQSSSKGGSLIPMLSNGYVPGVHGDFNVGNNILRPPQQQPQRAEGDVNLSSSTTLNKGSIWHVENDVFGGLKHNEAEISLGTPKRNHHPYNHDNNNSSSKKKKNHPQKNSRRASVASMDSMDSDSANTLSFGKL